MMALSRTPTENLALKLLARGGIAAIWQLHIAAAQAHRKGCPRAAAMVSEIAEAAEEAWLRAEGARAPSLRRPPSPFHGLERLA